jgi:hypothetical protein
MKIGITPNGFISVKKEVKAINPKFISSDILVFFFELNSGENTM